MAEPAAPAAPKLEAFVNNVDSYVGNAICLGLERTGKYRISGTLQGGADSQVPRNVKRIVTRMVPANLLRRIGSASLVVYDLHEADLEEVEFVYQGLQQGDFLKPLCVVLISSVHTWASTRVELEERPKPKVSAVPSVHHTEGSKQEAASQQEAEEGEPVEPPEPEPEEDWMQPTLSCESSYTERRAPAKFAAWHALEQRFLALNRKENVSAFVLAAGVLYGQGELFLHDPFVSALLDGGESFRTVGPGYNYLPLAHVMDVVEVVHRCGWKTLGTDEEAEQWQRLCDRPYLVVQDRTHATQREVLASIVGALGDPKKYGQVPAIEHEQAMLVDHATTLGGVNLRFAPTQLCDEAFPWWGTGSFVEDAADIAKEFLDCRHCAPIEVVVGGPPGIGKTALCAKLAERFRLVHVQLGPLLDTAKREETELGKQVAELLEAGTRLEPDLVKQLVELALGENAAKYRGYVLDGYPRSRDEARALFIEEVPAPEPAEGEEAQPPTERAKREPRVVYDLGFPPSEEHGELELLVERCRARPEEDPALVEGHNDEAGLTRRHGAQSDKAVEFFKETCADRVVALDAAQALEDVYKQAALDLLGRDLPFNYLDEVDFEERKESKEVEPVEEGELSPEAIEQQKKEEEEQKKLQEVIERERELLVKQSGPLRTYLMQVVVPHIQKALMEVCHLQPEDPVDYLAEYLFHAAVAEQELGELPKAWRENPWVEPVQKDR